MSTSNAPKKFVQGSKQGFNWQKSMVAVFIDFKGVYEAVWRTSSSVNTTYMEWEDTCAKLVYKILHSEMGKDTVGRCTLELQAI